MKDSFKGPNKQLHVQYNFIKTEKNIGDLSDKSDNN